MVVGSNSAWPKETSVDEYAKLVQGCSAVMLQREIPEYVNEALAAAAHKAGVTVFQDVGGDDRPISDGTVLFIYIYVYMYVYVYMHIMYLYIYVCMYVYA